jgi:hypothetical protein
VVSVEINPWNTYNQTDGIKYSFNELISASKEKINLGKKKVF